jgi:pyruvate formate lyase activating enzyme
MNAPISLSAAAQPRWLAEPQRPLKVGGFTPFSATDYPGKLAAVVFVQGCPWACGYCHNPHLQSRIANGALAWSAVIALLKRRVGLIDAVVFSGGEATMDPALADAMREVRALGFGVGLHTAGMYPRRLQEVLPLVDWVGIDIKATPQGYDAITGIADSARPALASAQAVVDSGVPHEFRTTVHPALHSERDIVTLAHTLRALGVRNYALQVFRSTGCTDDDLNRARTAGYPSTPCTAQVSAMFETFTLRRD